MRLHRFYIAQQMLGEQVQMENSEILHQWSKVLRLKQDEHVVLFDGRGNEAEYQITTLGKHKAELTRVSVRDKPVSCPACKRYDWNKEAKDENNKH